MFDELKANNLCKLFTDLPGVKLPKQLTEAIKAFHEAQDTPIAAPQEQPKDVSARLLQLATQLAAEDYERPARNQLKANAASKLYPAARDAVPEVTAQLSKQFTPAADSFTEAVKKLPEDLDESSLIRAGSEALKALETAQEASKTITMIESFTKGVISEVYSAKQRPKGVVAGDPLKITKPSTISEYQKLVDANPSNLPKGLRQNLNVVALTAVQNGVPLVMHSIEDIAREYERIRNQMPTDYISRTNQNMPRLKNM
ncbi:hypothetical protein [Actinopolyspora halophila]|uniref:hypothetical protein n=1 Tax=Actinopolyspora halophila TaxID=1850 RepID=UPI00036A0D53|nr:hypothetical protein [Actinopolyspora halophila]